MKSLILEAAAVDDDNAQSCWQVKDIKLAPEGNWPSVSILRVGGWGPCKISDLTLHYFAQTLWLFRASVQTSSRCCKDAVRVVVLCSILAIRTVKLHIAIDWRV